MMVRAGHPAKQSVAAAFSMRRKTRKTSDKAKRK
jgi:hypothetical protein